MKTDFPIAVDMQLTYRCNLRCKMCGQWGENGIFRKKIKELMAREIDSETWLSAVEAASRHGSEISLWGGEPLLSKSFIPISERACALGLNVSIVTNGTLLEDFAEFIVKNRFNKIYLSLDGDGKAHDVIRGQDGAFDKLKNAVRRIVKIRGRNPVPYVEVLCVVQKDNEDKLGDVARNAATLGADRIMFSPLMFISPDTHDKQKAIMSDLFGTEWTCSAGWNLPEMKASPEMAEPFLKSLPKKYGETEITTSLPENASLHEWQENPSNIFGRKRCLVPWRKINIMPNGDCNFCMDFPDYIIGNIKTQSLEEIWNGRKATLFRETMQKKGIFPVCKRCVWLYNNSLNKKYIRTH